MSNKPESNQGAYSASHVVDAYAGMTGLSPAEVRVVARCSRWICDGDVLDVGVGAGRTTAYLYPLAGTYCGLDFAKGMVERCRRRFPGANITQGDARTLQFASESFSFLIFSFNGIDYIHPHERQKALEEAFRVLRPGGKFAYSSHNLRVLGNRVPGFLTPLPQLSRNPFTFASRCVESVRTFVVGRRNYRRLQPNEFINERVAWVNDGIHDYSLLTCYVAPEKMPEELRNAGFAHEVEMIGHDGHDARPDTRDPWLYAIATKPE